MNLQKLNEAIAAYKTYLANHAQALPPVACESQRIFQDNWDAGAIDFKTMFDRSLQNSRTRRLWKRENYEPKDMMLKFIDLNQEFVRQAFQDLFNENKDVEGRIDRFVFHCNELLREYKETFPRSVENSHYHDDGYQMVSLYLAFRYPAQYAPYHFEGFRRLMEHLGSREVPKVNDMGRFFKIMRTVYGFLKKDEELLALFHQRLDPAKDYREESLLMCEEFLRHTAGIKKDAV